ncbi:MAG: hypothetical protein V1489_00815 [Candidatus Liptonbacteria bacterium]
MNSELKKTISILGVAILVAIAIYGSYLPYRKSSLYIEANRNAQEATTLIEFENSIQPSLDAPSPIGQNELVRNVAGNMLGIVRNAGQNSELVKATMDFINSYYQPIIQKGSGPSFNQDLYLLGILNQSAFGSTRDQSYLFAAQRYYEEGNQRAPERPQTLYGLFDVYRYEGNVSGVERVANDILTHWPDANAIRSLYENFESRAHATGTTASSSSSGSQKR